MLKIAAAFESFFAGLRIVFLFIGMFFVSLIGDPNYTGGLSGYGQPDMPQWWWVETYDECLAAIDKLDSKGSTFDTSTIFSYEGGEFDVKYCFSLERRNYLKYGRDNPFNRKNENVKICAFIFLEDTSIDDFAYSYVNTYCAYYFSLSPEYLDKYQDVDAGELEMNYNPVFLNPNRDKMVYDESLDYTAKDTGELVFQMVGQREEMMIPLSDADIDAILDSVVIIGGK